MHCGSELSERAVHPSIRYRFFSLWIKSEHAQESFLALPTLIWPTSRVFGSVNSSVRGPEARISTRSHVTVRQYLAICPLHGSSKDCDPR
jgi:hypothetical protein